MISFEAGGLRFDLRAAAVITDGGRVLLHRRDEDAFWSLPGGRAEAGEEAAAAVVRELAEELALPVRAGRLLWVVENFFRYAGRETHELGLYFEATPDPGAMVLCTPGPYLGQEGGRKLHFAWFERGRLDEVDLRPSFIAQALAAPELEPGHRVQREA